MSNPIEILTKKLKAVHYMIGDSELAVRPDEFDDFHRDKAERELRETPEVVQESIKLLCDMLAEEENLFVPLEEWFLQRFLRPCKWYPKSAFKLIKRYYEYKLNHPEFYDNLVPSNEREIYKSSILTPLPRRCADGARVVVIEAGQQWNPKEVTLEQIFRGAILILEVAITEPKTQVGGVRVIMDMEGLTLTHVTYFSPSFASAVVEFVQKSLTCRLKGFHIVNQSYLFDMVFAFFKPFIHGKLRDRIYFHGVDRPSILDYIDPKVCPKKYGGEFEFEPLGESLYEYGLTYDEYFTDANRYGYVNEL
ncbi:alpha-tocopherol transfer protein-like [Phymastichus coffea]|uniref:alpha-tocopherol transfer protein-like n=1 Tax=Phymastichus coffea TaxID=108790 RepID=UPI00273BD5EF|nr:alpha-tocopherol transfer protein-like [Phymastichus coffea]XP_058795632.1 alpha-tocopherol transfer protein-like [Phymastichus coffea]XP_058795633.1 alpha-tocopherol transfer protein-like [Phymastichus coffea]XP_058795634.1 alpha-tocopherol transfer protein-like [Phymastichus coffea]